MYLANNIASAYIDIIGRGENLTGELLKEAIAAEEATVNFSQEFPGHVRERFLRNLRVAYEKDGRWEESLVLYQGAYQLASGSWRSTHCVASYYRKKL